MTIHSPYLTRPEISGLVALPKDPGAPDAPLRHLFVRSHGPSIDSNDKSTHTGDPIVLIESGGGGSSLIWNGLARHLSQKLRLRVIAYDRAGIGHSDWVPDNQLHRPSHPHPSHNTLEDDLPKEGKRDPAAATADLSSLLSVLGIRSSGRKVIYLTHSFGGISSRLSIEAELSSLGHGIHIAGLVLVDTISRYDTMPFREKDYDFLFQLDYGKITGLDDSYELLTAEEYASLPDDVARSQGEMIDIDLAAARLSALKQYDRQVLGRRPVAVVKGSLTRDLGRLLDEAERVGLGTREQRENLRVKLPAAKKALSVLQDEQVRLTASDWSRFWVAGDSGHLPFLTEPEVVVEAVEWVLKSAIENDL